MVKRSFSIWLVLIFFICLASLSHAQKEDRISSIDFIQILDGNTEEAMFYYQHNWKVLRDMAVNRGLIHSFQLLETPFSEEAPFHLILMTTYENQAQYDQRELNFRTLIEERGEVLLLNEKEPAVFRRAVFGKDEVRHWK